MTQYIVKRKYVSAVDLGTETPWIPKDLVVNADGWELFDEFTSFYHGEEQKVVYHIRNDQLISIEINGFVREVTDNEHE